MLPTFLIHLIGVSVMSDYHIKRAKEIVETINYATLATVSSDGQPWNSPVYCNHDANLNIYWVSDKKNQHSKNIDDNHKVFIVIYDSTAPEGAGEGVYILARAYVLDDPTEITKARRLKKGPNYDDSPEDFIGEAVRRVYKAEPEHIWMNDAEEKNGVFMRDFRIEIPIDELRGKLRSPDER